MNGFTEKNLKMDTNNVDVQIIKESEATSNDSDNSSINIEAGDANIGLDLLANNNKVIKSNDIDEKKNHEEIDLIKNAIENDSDDKNEKKSINESDSDSDSDSDSISIVVPVSIFVSVSDFS